MYDFLPTAPDSRPPVLTRLQWWAVWLLILACLGLSGVRWSVTGSILGGDAVYYFCTLRSAVVDQDLNFANEYRFFHEARSKYTGNPKIKKIPAPSAATGRLPNKYPIGVPLLLLPWYLVGYFLSQLLAGLGLPLANQGYGVIPLGMCLLGSVVYGATGLIMILKAGLKYFDSSQAGPAMVLVFGATPLAYYMTMEPLMSHSFSVFTMGLFIWGWLALRDSDSTWRWFALGGAGALAGLVRYQDALVVLLPLADGLLAMMTKARTHGFWRRRLVQLVLMGVGMGLTLIPQAWVNHSLYGSFWTTGYTGEGFPNWANPLLFFSLFSKESGLILWAPVHVLALWGLFRFARENRAGLLFMGYFVLQWYLVSSWWASSQGHSFGNRMLISCSPMFALGLMQVFKIADVAKNKKAWWGLCVLLVALNGVLIVLYCFRLIGHPY